MNSTPSLPYRLSEKAFRKYEPWIMQITLKYPENTQLLCEDNPNTFCARLRDAMASFAKYKWKSLISFVGFTTAYENTKICHTPTGQVWAMRKDCAMKGVAAAAEMVSGNANSNSALDQNNDLGNPTDSDLEALAKLLSSRVLAGKFTFQHWSKEFVFALEQNWDVEVVEVGEGKYSIQ